MVVAGDEGSLNVGGVGDGLAEAVSCERHDGGVCLAGLLVEEMWYGLGLEGEERKKLEGHGGVK